MLLMNQSGGKDGVCCDRCLGMMDFSEQWTCPACGYVDKEIVEMSVPDGCLHVTEGVLI